MANTAKTTANQRRQATYEENPGSPLKIMLGVGCFGLAVLLVYLVTAQPQPGTTMATIHTVIKGIGGSIHPVLALILIWVGVLLIVSSRGNRLRKLDIFVNAVLFLCLFTAVQLFSTELILRTRMTITSYANYLTQSYLYGAGGGLLGAIFAYPLYIYLGGKWGGLIALCLVAVLGLLATGRLQRLMRWAMERADESARRHAEREQERLFETRNAGRAQTFDNRNAGRAQAFDNRNAPARHDPMDAPDSRRREPRDRDYIVIEDPPRVSRNPASGYPRGGRNLSSVDMERRDRSRQSGSRAQWPDEAMAGERRRVQPDEAMTGERRRVQPDEAMAGERRRVQPERRAPYQAAEHGPVHIVERDDAPRPGRDTQARDTAANARRPVHIVERDQRNKPVSDVPDFFTVHDDLPEEAVPERPAADGATAAVYTDAEAAEPAVQPEAQVNNTAETARPPEVHELPPEQLPEALRGGDEHESEPVHIQDISQKQPRRPAKRDDEDDDEQAGFHACDPEGEDEEDYFYPPIDLLTPGEQQRSTQVQKDADRDKAGKLIETLESFGIETRLIGIAHGPAVTRFELQPAPGVKVSRITALADDIALGLAALSVRIEAPIPGKSAVGVEIPNDKVETVRLRDVLECPEAKRHPSKLAVGLGKDNSGRYIVADIAKMPHVLIAGQTGSGKSVCINSIITSILYRAAPDEVRMILIDPKVVELSIYNDIPHLIAPVVTDPKKASSALDWAVAEMTSRYKRFAERDVRDIKGYNKKLEPGEKPMPQIVIIIDELADLMMVAPGEVEDSICRLAQLARAAGMHLVIATQRPSVNVITGIIKANIPTRIAFSVASQIDSRTMIDHGGAEKLLGNGDMLFVPSGINKPLRVQGAWVSDEEVHAIVSYIKARSETTYDEDVVEKIENSVRSDAEREDTEDEYDPRLPEAVEIVVEAGQASTSMLQRRMRVGYARAGRLIDEMERRGVIGEADGSKPRNVLITREQFRAQFGGDGGLVEEEDVAS